MDDSAVKFLLGIGFREDIAANLVANAIWATLTILIPIYYISRRFFTFAKYKAKIPLKIFFFSLVFTLTKRMRGRQLNIDGFYFAVYDASRPQTNTTNSTESPQPVTLNPKSASKRKKPKSTQQLSDSKVAECIYLKTGIFSGRLKGYVFRRAKRKRGEIEQNDFYLSKTLINDLRIVGSFSDDLHILFGYWLDPYDPNTVAGTLRLKWLDNNIGIERAKRKTYFIGEWDGFNKKSTTTISERAKRYYGFPKTGGTWRFHKVASTVNEFAQWNSSIINDSIDNPAAFIDWTPQ